jgi:hypothetical protein
MGTGTNRRTSIAEVFTAGDMTRGQSLVVWAITEGRHRAHAIDEFFRGLPDLPKPPEFGHDHRPFGREDARSDSPTPRVPVAQAGARSAGHR